MCRYLVQSWHLHFSCSNFDCMIYAVARCLSVHLSIRLSVTRQYSVKTVIATQF